MQKPNAPPKKFVATPLVCRDCRADGICSTSNWTTGVSACYARIVRRARGVLLNKSGRTKPQHRAEAYVTRGEPKLRKARSPRFRKHLITQTQMVLAKKPGTERRVLWAASVAETGFVGA